jgi:hypothetical protein
MLRLFGATTSPLPRAVVLCFCTAVALSAQERSGPGTGASGPSRAQQEAAQHVSLSADKIIEILEKEPGLLLQIKKLLVQDAFEQGRLVDTKDLNDQAIFRLLREDENARILATREIEARGYISLKPSREEAEQQKQREATWQRQIMTTYRRPEQANSSDQRIAAHRGERDGENNRSSPGFAGRDAQARSTPARADSEPEESTHGDRRAYQKQDQDSWASTAPGADGRDRMRRGESQALENSRSNPGVAVQELDHQGPVKNGHDAPTPSIPIMRDQIMPDQDRPAIVSRPNPYFNVPSLYDLYAQVSARPPVLERFGMEIFRNSTSNLKQVPMDLPVGTDYVLGRAVLLMADTAGLCRPIRWSPVAGPAGCNQHRLPVVSFGWTERSDAAQTLL